MLNKEGLKQELDLLSKRPCYTKIHPKKLVNLQQFPLLISSTRWPKKSWRISHATDLSGRNHLHDRSWGRWSASWVQDEVQSYYLIYSPIYCVNVNLFTSRHIAEGGETQQLEAFRNTRAQRLAQAQQVQNQAAAPHGLMQNQAGGLMRPLMTCEADPQVDWQMSVCPSDLIQIVRRREQLGLSIWSNQSSYGYINAKFVLTTSPRRSEVSPNYKTFSAKIPSQIFSAKIWFGQPN